MGKKWRFPNYSLLARAVKQEFESDNQHWAWRTLTMAIDDSKTASDQELLDIVSLRPDSTGEIRADAAVAGMAEWLCAKRSLMPPAWTQEVWREVTPWWFVVDSEEVRHVALVESPVSFAKRGIFITRSGLMRL